MDKQTTDELLAAMIAGEGVSDLIFTVGKPPCVETHGVLQEFTVSCGTLGREQIASLAEHIINGDERLRKDLSEWGSLHRQPTIHQQNWRRPFVVNGSHGQQSAHAGNASLWRERRPHFSGDHRSREHAGLA